MKAIDLQLLDDVVTSYDQTKTTVQGRVFEKTLSGKQVLGPPLNVKIDVFADSGLNPIATFGSDNGRIFVLADADGGTISSTASSILLYEIDYDTGAYMYKGRINIILPNTATTTHTLRGFKVDDTGTTGWKLFIATTGSVTTNAGLFMVNSIDLADFVLVGFPNIGFALGSNQKAIYFLQDPAMIGATHIMTQAAGLILDKTNTLIYLHNGVSATHQYHWFDYSVTPNCPAQTVASFTIASPGKVNIVGHGYLLNDPIVFSTTGTLPTGIVAGTVYFINNPTANDFEIKATTGGASINFTGSASGVNTINRAYGQTSSLTYVKTGNLPALAGTLLLTNSEDLATPDHSANSGFPCAAFLTTTNLYLGKLSDLSSGSPTWVSLITSNLQAAPLETITLVPTFGGFSEVLDRFYFFQNGRIYFKQLVNNNVDLTIGSIRNQYLETLSMANPILGFSAISNLEIREGWILMLGQTVGQRVVLGCDILSEEFFDNSFIVSKVIDTPNANAIALYLEQQYSNVNNNTKIYYRTSGFGSISGGWILVNDEKDFTAVAIADQIQFKILFHLDKDGTGRYSQVGKGLFIIESENEISDNFEYSHENSSLVSPSRVAFRLKKAYASSVPQLFFRAYDLSGTLVASHNTTSNPGFFEYSTNDGANWNALGTIPNTVGTLVRYTFSADPGVDIRPSLRES